VLALVLVLVLVLALVLVRRSRGGVVSYGEAVRTT